LVTKETEFAAGRIPLPLIDARSETLPWNADLSLLA
jgi:hypothetical protein